MSHIFTAMDDLKTFGFWFTYEKIRQRQSIVQTLWIIFVATKTTKHNISWR